MNQEMTRKNFAMSQDFSKIRYIIAVAAGKGGVGKSSMSVGLACSLKEAGYDVGILDADIYGPSLGRMMPLEVLITKDEASGKLYPGEFQGVKALSLAHLRPDGEAMIVRAPIANGIILQCIQETCWGDLDYLIIDFPPGTGDIQLTLMQEIPFSAAILVTTPQEISLIDVKKAAQMFHHMGVPIIGIIENMAYFQDPDSQKKHRLFGEGGGKKLSDLFGAPFLGEMPIDPNLCSSAEQGVNFIRSFKESPAAKKFHEIALLLRDLLFEMESFEGSYSKKFELIWKEMD